MLQCRFELDAKSVIITWNNVYDFYVDSVATQQ